MIIQIDLSNCDFSRRQKVGTRMCNDLRWFSSFLWFAVGGRSCSNFLASTQIHMHLNERNKLQRPAKLTAAGLVRAFRHKGSIVCDLSVRPSSGVRAPPTEGTCQGSSHRVLHFAELHLQEPRMRCLEGCVGTGRSSMYRQPRRANCTPSSGIQNVGVTGLSLGLPSCLQVPQPPPCLKSQTV